MKAVAARNCFNGFAGGLHLGGWRGAGICCDGALPPPKKKEKKKQKTRRRTKRQKRQVRVGTFHGASFCSDVAVPSGDGGGRGGEALGAGHLQGVSLCRPFAGGGGLYGCHPGPQLLAACGPRCGGQLALADVHALHRRGGRTGISVLAGVETRGPISASTATGTRFEQGSRNSCPGLGTLAVLSSYGGLRNYFTTASAQFELTDYLTRYMEHAGLKYRWRQQRARDVASAFLLWSTSVGAYLWFHEGRFTSLAYTRLFGYAFRLACLLSACVLQISKWRGITLMIVAFAQALSGQGFFKLGCSGNHF